jgi:hypothetical protein
MEQQKEEPRKYSGLCKEQIIDRQRQFSLNEYPRQRVHILAILWHQG